MPRKNASSKAKGFQSWKEMIGFYQNHKKAFEIRYHKRSNAEATNSSFKGKYSEFLYSRKWFMQKREVGLKIITHNLRQLIRFRIRHGVELLD